MNKIVFRHLFLVISSPLWACLSHTIVRRHKTISQREGGAREKESQLLMDRAWLGNNRSMSERSTVLHNFPLECFTLAKRKLFRTAISHSECFAPKTQRSALKASSACSMFCRVKAKNVSLELASLCEKLFQLTSERDGEWSK
jgi:hypothetical protein